MSILNAKVGPEEGLLQMSILNTKVGPEEVCFRCLF